MSASEDLALPIIFVILLSGVTSRDIEVFVNDSLSMRCSPKELPITDIQWHHNSDFTYVYAGGKLRPPYDSRFLLKKDEKTGDYDLIIPKVTLEDAGWYYCSKEIDGRRINSTQLTVLYMKPVCNANMPTDGFIGPNTCNIQQENMTFSCHVIFNGRPPHLSWRSANDSQVFNSSFCEVKSNKRSCSLTLRAGPSYDGSVFRCDVGQIKLDDLRYSCNTERINVQYFFGYYVHKEKYVHENASCVVRSNLNVRYNWTLKQDNEEIFLTSKQTVSIKRPGLHQCEVKYSIINVTCSTLLLVVNATEAIKMTDAQKEQSSKRKCMKCSVQTAYARELPCKHVICPDCVQALVREKGRNYGIECPTCKSQFTVTVVPQERRQQEQSKYVKDEYKVKMRQDRSPLCLKSKVMCMAMMGNNLFVVCEESPNIILKFDLGASDGNEAVPVKLSISDMVGPRGMAASENHSYLYITDWRGKFTGKLWRYNYYMRGEETRVNDPVADLEAQPFGISVSPKNDEVLVTCGTPIDEFHEKRWMRGWIYIYKPSGDEFPKIRTIDVPDVEMPRHAILAASSQFIVCHGWSSMARHGVTSFEDGKNGALVAKRFYGRDSVGGGADENEMNCPRSLTIDRNRMILVVDYNNNRIQLLTEDFQLVRHLLTKKEHGIEYPLHVCQDPSTGRLYVGQEDGKVRTFN